MRKRHILALVTSMAILAFSAVTEGRGDRAELKPVRSSGGSGFLCLDKGDAAALLLPKGKDAWLIEISRSGGRVGSKETVRINSAGEISVVSEHYGNGGPTVDCSRKETISPRELLKIKAAITSAQPSDWKNSYDDPQHPICCDQTTTGVKLQRRNEKGQAQSYTTSWYNGTYKMVPADLKGISTFIQPLWNATQAHCEK